MLMQIYLNQKFIKIFFGGHGPKYVYSLATQL